MIFVHSNDHRVIINRGISKFTYLKPNEWFLASSPMPTHTLSRYIYCSTNRYTNTQDRSDSARNIGGKRSLGKAGRRKKVWSYVQNDVIH
jgi:hypothetical protein